MKKVELQIGKTYYIWRFNLISGNPDYIGMLYYVGKKLFCRELGPSWAGMIMHPVTADIAVSSDDKRIEHYYFNTNVLTKIDLNLLDFRIDKAEVIDLPSKSLEEFEWWNDFVKENNLK